MKALNAIIQLRRDNDYNFNKIKDTFIPKNGEAVLVDTNNQGLRIKIGNGHTPYGDLPFADENSRQAVLMGYYFDGIFYKDFDKNEVMVADGNKLYIDKNRNNAYFYNGINYINLQSYAEATADQAGIAKLYNTLGNNTDGSITQHTITQEFNVRYKTSVDTAEETLIFSL